MKINGYLRCRLTKNSPRRTSSTPAGVFCTLLASTPSICKKDYYKEQTVNLSRLFAKRPVTFGKQHNFFTTNQLSHKTRKKIFHSVCFFISERPFGLGQFNPNQGRYSRQNFKANPFCRDVLPLQRQTRGLRGYFPLKNLFRRTVC